MKSKITFSTLLLSLLLSSCINNVEELNSPNISSDDVSYSADIQTIFNASCGNSGCHINNTTSGVNLASYSSVMNSVGAQYGAAIVIPEDPDGSPIVDKISPNPQNGARMPLSGSPLTPVEIAKIKAWIEGGAEDN